MCIEFDATTHGALPAEDYPGLTFIREFWDENPWSRVNFGAQFVLSPDGQYMLSVGSQRHFRHGESKLFRSVLEESIERYRRIRRFEKGSSEEAEAVRKVIEQVARDWKARHPYFVDPELWTRELFAADFHLERRCSGILTHEEAEVRQGVVELIAGYVENEGGGSHFLPGAKWSFFGEGIAALLEDPEPGVRQAAALALHRFFEEPAPTDDPTSLVAAARELWDDRAPEEVGSMADGGTE